MDNIYSLLNIGKLTEEECKNCWAFTQCIICAKKVDKNGTLSAEKKKKFCNESKEAVFSIIKNKVLLFELNKHLSRVIKTPSNMTKDNNKNVPLSNFN